MRLHQTPSFVSLCNALMVAIAFSGSQSPVFVVVAAVASSSSLSSGRRPPTCEPIAVESCRHIGYNMTSMPNLVNDETQLEAERQFMTYQSLVQYGCSKRLQLFLCASYFPMCTDKVRRFCVDIFYIAGLISNKCYVLYWSTIFWLSEVLICRIFPIWKFVSSY